MWISGCMSDMNDLAGNLRNWLSLGKYENLVGEKPRCVVGSVETAIFRMEGFCCMVPYLNLNTLPWTCSKLASSKFPREYSQEITLSIPETSFQPYVFPPVPGSPPLKHRKKTIRTESNLSTQALPHLPTMRLEWAMPTKNPRLKKWRIDFGIFWADS